MNPYDVLGVPPSCSIDDIRKAYKRLAMQNHPDKLQHLSPDKRAEHEELFKNITVAYHVLMQEHDRSQPHTTDTWKQMWSQMEMFLNEKNVWSTVFDVATRYIKVKRHRVRLPVTLEEIYTRYNKKVEFVLKGLAMPPRTMINCGEYPETSFDFEDEHGRNHHVIVMLVDKEHDVYDMEDGNLHATVFLKWGEYLNGCEVLLPFLDGTDVTVTIPPCWNITIPVAVQGKGMDDEHSLYIDVRLDGANHEKWGSLSARDRSDLLDVLKRIQE